jgi:hypothetical protein
MPTVVLLVHTYLYPELIVGFYGLVGWPLIVAIIVFRCSSTRSDQIIYISYGRTVLGSRKFLHLYTTSSN